MKNKLKSTVKNNAKKITFIVYRSQTSKVNVKPSKKFTTSLYGKETFTGLYTFGIYVYMDFLFSFYTLSIPVVCSQI